MVPRPAARTWASLLKNPPAHNYQPGRGKNRSENDRGRYYHRILTTKILTGNTGGQRISPTSHGNVGAREVGEEEKDGVWQTVGGDVRGVRTEQHPGEAAPPQQGNSSSKGSSSANSSNVLMAQAHRSPMDQATGKVRCRACGQVCRSHSCIHLKQKIFLFSSLLRWKGCQVQTSSRTYRRTHSCTSHACTRTRAHLLLHTQAHTFMHIARLHAHTCARAQARTHTRSRTHSHTHTHTHTLACATRTRTRTR